jgi:predicted GH43/DUF377 family glycosyl hydrolase
VELRRRHLGSAVDAEHELHHRLDVYSGIRYDCPVLAADWMLGPFTRVPGAVLGPRDDLRFRCPVSGADVQWAAKDVFNPAAVVHDGRVHLLVRAEDRIGRFAGTSRLGLASSDDGLEFTLEPEPVLHPDDDPWQAWEWPGGCEDPRVVESPDGGFVCLYTAFDGKGATLCAASSTDLRVWQKHGPVFAGTSHAKRHSKSGSIVTEVRDGRLVASRIAGRYWMYWGEGVGYAATSDDLVAWQPLEFDPGRDRYLALNDDGWRSHTVPGQRVLRPVLHPRRGRFDSLLVEPGPPAILTGEGIVLLYNGANRPTPDTPRTYQAGQALFDLNDPASCIGRCTEPFFRAGAEDTSGQVDNVVFTEGLVWWRGQWILYFGMADSRIGCATSGRLP